MKINFQLSKEDYLILQLYLASQSSSIAKRRKLARWLVPVFYLFFGLFPFLAKNYLFATVFPLGALAWYFLYPAYTRKRYHSYFESSVKDHFENKTNHQYSLQFSDDHLTAVNTEGTDKIKITDIQEMVELSNHLILKFSNHPSLIIPKNAISEMEQFNQFFSKHGIQQENEIYWQWK